MKQTDKTTVTLIHTPQDYISSNGKNVEKCSIDLTARILSMGKLHHAVTGTGAVDIAAAAAISRNPKKSSCFSPLFAA
jgi:2-methylaconitate cis-trans-isomerase PrpF